MRNKRFFFVLIGALLFGLLAAVSVSRYLSSAQAYTKNLNNVAVAKVAIPPAKAPLPMLTPPSLNVAVPVAVPEPGALALTVAVNVTN